MTGPIAAVLLLLTLWLPQGSTPVNRDAQIQKEFGDRVSKYLDLRKSVESRLPALPDKAEPEAITAHQKALLKALQRARTTARQGDIFRPESRRLIRRLLTGALTTGSPAPRQAMREENPGVVPLRVNGEFPTSLPRPTVPPQVLLALPRLPDEELEFRFLGSRLLLLDSRANMVIDFMDRALPS